MSSSKVFKSKVFKGDNLFTPHSLVRENLAPPPEPELKPKPKPKPGNDEPEHAKQATQKSQPQAEAEDQLEEPVAAPKPEPQPKPKPEPAPKPPPPQPPPEPKVDTEAIRREGYEQGKADCAAQLQADFDQAIQSFTQACQKIDQLNHQRLNETHADLVNLIIALTEKILSQELSTPRNQIATILENALEQAIASEEFHVALNPEDLAFAEEKAPALINSIRGLEHLVFKADPGIRRGGCLLESVSCSVDATIDGKLESARTLLTEHPELLLSSDEDGEDAAPLITEEAEQNAEGLKEEP